MSLYLNTVYLGHNMTLLYRCSPGVGKPALAQPRQATPTPSQDHPHPAVLEPHPHPSTPSHTQPRPAPPSHTDKVRSGEVGRAIATITATTMTRLLRPLPCLFRHSNIWRSGICRVIGIGMFVAAFCRVSSQELKTSCWFVLLLKP